MSGVGGCPGVSALGQVSCKCSSADAGLKPTVVSSGEQKVARKTNCTGLDPGCFTGPGREEPKSWIGAGTDGQDQPTERRGSGLTCCGTGWGGKSLWEGAQTCQAGWRLSSGP